MNAKSFDPNFDLNDAGQAMYRLIAELFPICRSITGDGFRASLNIVQREIPVELFEVPTGTPVFDWTVPREWNIRDAYVKNSRGERVVDFQKSNLCVVNYSAPIHRTMSRAELQAHLFSLPDHPTWIPYRTAYYKETWGFCVSDQTLQNLADDEYAVCIDATLAPGHLTYGEFFLRGQSDDEIFISTHCCHPSLCNDNLSGIALATLLAKHLRQFATRYSYRFVFIPGTIGSITWLARNEDRVAKIKHGLVVACVGDPGKFHYKKSRRGDAAIDRAAQIVLRNARRDFVIEEFSPYGYDERQYCSPGFNLAVGSLTRTPHGRYPEYHTSADNLDFVQPHALAESLAMYLQVLNVLEQNRKFFNTNPKCEPQLGRRGLYGQFGGRKDQSAYELAMLWVLNFSDGAHSLLDIAEKSGIAFALIADAARALVEHNLLREDSTER